jgi:hypothetical protein
VAFVSDAVFYGREQPLSVFEYGGALGKRKRINTESTERRAQRSPRKKGGGPGLTAARVDSA